MKVKRLCSIGVSAVLLVLGPLVFGQSFYDAISGTAVACNHRVPFTKLGHGPLGPFTVKTSCKFGSASVTASANMGNETVGNKAAASVTTTKSGGGQGISTWDDYLTVIPPSSFTGDKVTLEFTDSYFVNIKGPIPQGLTAAEPCYYIFSAGLEDCTEYHAPANAKPKVKKFFSLTKASGQFTSYAQFTITVNAGGGSSSKVAEPVGNSATGFTLRCPSEGYWEYTLASTGPNVKYLCSAY
jgi:hypothetical protein